ncbi:diguanylate cyclase [Sphingomonas sp. I4]
MDHGQPCLAIIVALSRLDLINAAHGRPAGNMLLRSVETRMQAAAAEVFGDGAVVARSGGAEFVMAGVAEPERARAIADTLETLLALPFQAGSVPIRLGVRLGLCRVATLGRPRQRSCARGRGAEPGAGRRRHDAALRASGRRDPLDVLAADLHHAIERGEIDIVFQPQVEI